MVAQPQPESSSRGSTFIFDGGSSHSVVFKFTMADPLPLCTSEKLVINKANVKLHEVMEDESRHEEFVEALEKALCALGRREGDTVFIGATGGVRKLIATGKQGAVEGFAQALRFGIGTKLGRKVEFKVVDGIDEARWEWLAARELFAKAFEGAEHVQVLAGGGSSVQFALCGMSTALGGTPPLTIPLETKMAVEGFQRDIEEKKEAAASGGAGGAAGGAAWPSLEASRAEMVRVVDAHTSKLKQAIAASSSPHSEVTREATGRGRRATAARVDGHIGGKVLCISGFADVAQLGFADRWVTAKEAAALVGELLEQLLARQGEAWAKAEAKWGARVESLWPIGAAGLLRLTVSCSTPKRPRPRPRPRPPLILTVALTPTPMRPCRCCSTRSGSSSTRTRSSTFRRARRRRRARRASRARARRPPRARSRRNWRGRWASSSRRRSSSMRRCRWSRRRRMSASRSRS